MISNPLGSLFGKSPIAPLQEHMAVVVKCAKQLTPFFEAVVNGDWTAASDSDRFIDIQEHHADELKKKLRLHLPKSLFMPVSRSDLLSLLSAQDDVANCAKVISGIVLGRKAAIPVALQTPLMTFVDSAVAVAEQALKAINELDELLETGFGSTEISFIEQLVERLDELEDDTERLEKDVRDQLFSIESDLSPVDVMFLYQIIDKISELASRAESVGGHLQLLVAR